MKKKYVIFFIVLMLLLMLSIIYVFNYKNAKECEQLLSKNNNITNLYVEAYIENEEYVENIKDYKIEFYLKDNICIYNTLGQIAYGNFSTNEYFIIENCEKKADLDISTWNKFNDYSYYFNSQDYKYSYNYPCYIDNTWCDRVSFKDTHDNIKSILYINKENGLLEKEITISTTNKTIKTFNNKINVVTDEQIKNLSYYN